MKKALLIIDVQNDYFKGGKCELFQPEIALKNIVDLKNSFDAQALPIYYIQHINASDASFFQENSEGVKLHADIAPKATTNVIVKHYPNSFYQTQLLEKLKHDNVEALIICGMMTHMCIDTTVRAAKDFGYPVQLIADGCTTKDLIWNNKTIPATTVHDTFMASLNGKFAEIVTTKQFLNKN